VAGRLVDQQAVNRLRVEFVLLSPIGMIRRILELMLDAVHLKPKLLRQLDQIRRIGRDGPEMAIEAVKERLLCYPRYSRMRLLRILAALAT
jgi:hypothetical protein